MKHGFSKSPKKGTRIRLALTMAMRPQGATISEILAAYGNDPHKMSYRANVHGALHITRDITGWDVRSFPCPREREKVMSGQRRHSRVYKVVGKMKWDGSYRSFVNPKEYRP